MLEVLVGGDNPISIQSMTNTLTTDIKSTVEQIVEIQNEEQIWLEFRVLMRTQRKL